MELKLTEIDRNEMDGWIFRGQAKSKVGPDLLILPISGFERLKKGYKIR